MDAICFGAKMAASNDSPVYAAVTEEVIKFKKEKRGEKKVTEWLTEYLRPEL